METPAALSIPDTRDALVAHLRAAGIGPVAIAARAGHASHMTASYALRGMAYNAAVVDAIADMSGLPRAVVDALLTPEGGKRPRGRPRKTEGGEVTTTSPP